MGGGGQGGMGQGMGGQQSFGMGSRGFGPQNYRPKGYGQQFGQQGSMAFNPNQGLRQPGQPAGFEGDGDVFAQQGPAPLQISRGAPPGTGGYSPAPQRFQPQNGQLPQGSMAGGGMNYGQPKGMPQTGGRHVWNEPQSSGMHPNMGIPMPKQGPQNGGFDPYKQFAMGQPGQIPGVMGNERAQQQPNDMGMLGRAQGGDMFNATGMGQEGGFQTGGNSPPPQSAPPQEALAQNAPRPNAAPAGWNGMDARDFTGDSGRQAFDWTGGGLSQNVTPTGPRNTWGKQGNVWWSDQAGKRIADPGMIGNGQRVGMNPGAGQYFMNWNGMGPGGFRASGNNR